MLLARGMSYLCVTLQSARDLGWNNTKSKRHNEKTTKHNRQTNNQ